MSTIIKGVYRIAFIRRSDKLAVVNFKASAPIGSKDAQGKYEYVNLEVAAWGEYYVKMFFPTDDKSPLIKEKDSVDLTLKLEKIETWEGKDKSGVTLKTKLLDLGLIYQQSDSSSEPSADDLAAATSQASSNPSVSDAAKDPTIPF
jgi:hypothetical protein